MSQDKSALLPVPFHGNTLYLIEHNGEPYTPMKPIVEGMGLTWASQLQKLNANKDRWATMSIIDTVAKDGKQRKTLCLPVRKLPAYMAGLNPNKVRPELRDRIRQYQAECDDALWDYWNTNRPTPPQPGWPPLLPSRKPVTTKLLITLRDGQAIHAEPVPPDALVTTIADIRDLMATRGYLVIHRAEIAERIAEALILVSHVEQHDE